MQLMVFSPCFVCDRWIPSFCSMSLPSRFTVLSGTTSISQFCAFEFPDDSCILSVLFILILLLLKHLNSPTLEAMFCISFPSLFIDEFAVVCETKLLGLPVSTSQCILHFTEWVFLCMYFILCIVHQVVLVGLCRNAICLGLSFFVGFFGLFLLPGHIVMFRSGGGLLITSPFEFVGFACLE